MSRMITICLMLAFSAFSVMPQARADEPDFSICEGQDGAAWGLCRAGAAAGCADDSGNSRACREIEDQYTEVTGQPPPWDAPPPATCPCNFSLVPMTNPPWSPDVSNPVSFTCPESPYGGGRDVFITDRDASPGSYTAVEYWFDFGVYHICETAEDSALLESEFNMSLAEQVACEADAIAYGQALKVALGSDVDDACTPTLP